MGRFTRKLAAAFAAVALTAGAAFAQFLVSDFNSPEDMTNLGFYHYFYAAPDEDVAQIRFPAGRQGPNDPSPGAAAFEHHPTGGRGGSGAFAMSVTLTTSGGTDRPDYVGTVVPICDITEYYPAWGMGIMLTKDDYTGYDEQHNVASSANTSFAEVDSIVFWARANAAITFGMKLETTEQGKPNIFNGQPLTDNEGKKNANVYRVMLNHDGSEEWQRYSIPLRPIISVPAQFLAGNTPYLGNNNCEDTRRTDGGRTIVGGFPEGWPARWTGPAWPLQPHDTTEINPNLPRVGHLTQEDWHGSITQFDPTQVTKLAWFIRSQDNAPRQSACEALPCPQGDRPVTTLFVDDVQFIGPNFRFVAHGNCPQCVGRTVAESHRRLISNFELEEPANFFPPTVTWEAPEEDWAFYNPVMNMLGYYWYYYHSFSEADNPIADGIGTDIDDDAIRHQPTGGNNGSGGIRIEWDAMTAEPSPNCLPRYMGLGVNFFDQDGAQTAEGVVASPATYFDASEFDGIYFEFNAPASVPHLRVELTDSTDITREKLGLGNCGEGDGLRFFVVVPNETPGQWTPVSVRFNELVLPSWLYTNDNKPLHDAPGGNRASIDRSRLLQIQIRYDGNTSGSLALDNVAFFAPGAVNVRNVARSTSAAALRASFNRGVVNVNWNAPMSIDNGRVSLVNARGRVVSSAPLTRVNDRRITANLGSNRIPAGMYFVRVDARDASGNRILQQAPVTIVR